ncbi:MAG: hypothetical protein MPJ50_16095 [Pirellulales bacterium]|nr:hypothetical protein [Pirellulales bacterium]
MSLRQQLATALTSQPTPLAAPAQLAVNHDVDHLEVELTALDSIACAFQRLALQTERIRGAGTDVLKKVSQDISTRVTYLLEAIGPIEIDSEGAVIQLRSLPPQKGDDGTVYYEMLVRNGGSIELRRWKNQPGSSARVPLQAEVTREVLLRLTEDFVAAAKFGESVNP